MNDLRIGPEGFVDLRSNPPPTTQTVNGWSPETDGQVVIKQETETVDVKAERPAVLPGRQKTAEGLVRPQAPVKVPKKEKASSLMRLVAVDDPATYAVVTAQQFHDMSKFEWHAVRTGHLYRRDGDKVIWAHREAAKCKRFDRFVAFRDGDQRNLTPNNLQVVKTKEKAKEIKRLALLATAGK